MHAQFKHRCASINLGRIDIVYRAIEHGEEIIWLLHGIVKGEESHIGEHHKDSLPIDSAKSSMLHHFEVATCQSIHKVLQVHVPQVLGIAEVCLIFLYILIKLDDMFLTTLHLDKQIVSLSNLGFLYSHL